MGEHSEAFVPDRRGQATECDPGSDLGAVDGRRISCAATACMPGCMRYRSPTGKPASFPMAATPRTSMQISMHPWGYRNSTCAAAASIAGVTRAGRRRLRDGPRGSQWGGHYGGSDRRAK